MKGDNAVDIAAPRRRAALEHPVPAGKEGRNADRSKEAMDILEELSRTPRIHKDDRPVVARNLGRLIIEIEPDSPKLLAKKILETSWQKRKRYIRFPNDPVGASVFYAASGLDFAGIIKGVAKERIKRGLDRNQAMVATIYDALKDTSFRRPSRFQIRDDFDEDDAAYLITTMKCVFDKLAQELELAEHFGRVSKYPIYPDCPYSESSTVLALDEKYTGNDIYDWDCWTDEDDFEIQKRIPWWAPRCVIGYLYIPFQNDCLHLPEQGIAELKKACGGEVTPENWENEYSRVLQPFMTPEYIRPRRVRYRLPVLLVGLPRPNRLVPCLYAAASHPTGFHQDEMVCYSQDNPVMPCYAAKIGDRLEDDHVFFYDICMDPETPVYVCAAESEILLMGSDIDGDLCEPDFWLAYSIDDMPDWLQSHPVQRFLKLTPDSNLGTNFAISHRDFPQQFYGENETVFRPSFPDSPTLTRLRPNTVGACLLRNFADAGEIFECLKSDALYKITATKTVIDTELKKTQEAFDRLYGNEVSEDHAS
jgi:hypothetical protein